MSEITVFISQLNCFANSSLPSREHLIQDSSEIGLSKSVEPNTGRRERSNTAERLHVYWDVCATEYFVRCLFGTHSQAIMMSLALIY
jgi:hypothetical protein